MPVSIIPFNMPEPVEIPSHIIDSLTSMPPDEAVAKGMDLLMQIEAADTMVYERISDCLLYTSPSPRDKRQSRMPSSA